MSRNAKADSPGRKGEAGGALRWTRGRFEILSQPIGIWGTAWEALPRLNVPLAEPDKPLPWVFEKTEFLTRPPGLFGPAAVDPWGRLHGTRVKIFRIGWPEGGVLVPEEGSVPEFY